MRLGFDVYAVVVAAAAAADDDDDDDDDGGDDDHDVGLRYRRAGAVDTQFPGWTTTLWQRSLRQVVEIVVTKTLSCIPVSTLNSPHHHRPLLLQGLSVIASP